MAKKLSDFVVELTGFFILFLVLFTVFHGGYSGKQFNQLLASIHFSVQLEDLSTVFLSMFIEGIPFILLSVIISNFIHIFINETPLFAKIPKTPLVGIPLASLFGLIFPICECGTVPVAGHYARVRWLFYSDVASTRAYHVANRNHCCDGH